ncbi:MAG: thiamine pyrophosphate-dependent dehydrogenase E1 component subunit alpha [Steroidobacteraceae bacterium]
MKTAETVQLPHGVSTKPMVALPERTKALGMYESMVRIRKYEEQIYFLFLEGRISGSIHQSHGQEACAVGMLYDTRPTDYMASTHRPAGHDLAKGVSVESMMCEMFGKANGCCHGKGGAMHTGDISVGAVPANAIVGSNIPISVGMAFSCKMLKTDDVVVCFFGDGATNEGGFHEGINGAALWNLPVVFACENNLYGASTHVQATMKVQTIAERAAAYGIPGERIDGNDLMTVNEAATRAIARARRGEGPTLLELMTYRIAGHSRSDASAYRPDEEEAAWLARDPIRLFRNRLIEERVATIGELDAIDNAVQEQVDKAVQFAESSPDPQPEDALGDVYAVGGRL